MKYKKKVKRAKFCLSETVIVTLGSTGWDRSRSVLEQHEYVYKNCIQLTKKNNDNEKKQDMEISMKTKTDQFNMDQLKLVKIEHFKYLWSLISFLMEVVRVKSLLNSTRHKSF